MQNSNVDGNAEYDDFVIYLKGVRLVLITLAITLEGSLALVGFT